MLAPARRLAPSCNGNANNASGNGLNGTNIAGLTYVSDLPGLVANFNGTSQYIARGSAYFRRRISLPAANDRDITLSWRLAGLHKFHAVLHI